MHFDLKELAYRFKKDSYYRQRLKKTVLLGCFGAILILCLIIVAGYYLFTPLVGYLFSFFPIVNEFLFTYARGFISGFAMENMLNLLTPISNNANVAELKGLITQYFEQLKTGSGIDFQSFQNFISTIKTIVSDGQITPEEIEKVRKLLPI